MLRPAAQVRVVIARAEFDQTGAALKVASCILERIGHTARFIESDVVGGVGIGPVAGAIGEINNRTQPIVVLLGLENSIFIFSLSNDRQRIQDLLLGKEYQQ